MRVALDVTPLLGARTGVGRFVEHLVPALAQAGVELAPYVLSARGARGAPGAAPDLPAGTRQVRLPAAALVRAWGGLGRPRLRRVVAGPGAAVVHGTNFVAPPDPRPTVLTVHDCSFVTDPVSAVPVVRAFAAVVRRAVAQGAWVHTPSRAVAEEAAALFGTDRVVAVPHGPPRLDPGDGRAPTLTGGAPYVLAVGTLEPRKNLPRLVAAFGRVAPEHPDLHLVLAGPDGADRPRVDAAVAALPATLAARVHLPGWTDGPARTELLRHAAVLAYPSLDEGFGLPLLEAMAVGTPVVAGRAGAIPEVAGDAARLVAPTDVDELAGALATVLADRPLREQLVAAGRAQLRRFSWAATAEGLATLYGRAAMERAR